MPERLREMGFADARRTDKQDILMLANEVTRCKIEDLLALDRRVECEIEILDR